MNKNGQNALSAAVERAMELIEWHVSCSRVTAVVMPIIEKEWVSLAGLNRRIAWVLYLITNTDIPSGSISEDSSISYYDGIHAGFISHEFSGKSNTAIPGVTNGSYINIPDIIFSSDGWLSKDGLDHIMRDLFPENIWNSVWNRYSIRVKYPYQISFSRMAGKTVCIEISRGE